LTSQEVIPLRRRIGIVCPDDGINDDEYWQYVPTDVTLLWTRYRTPRTFDPISVEMVGSYGDMRIVEQAAKTLEITRPEVVVFCCNSCGFVHGLDGDKRIRDAISKATGSPAISVTDSEVQALHALGVKRVAVGGPYPDDVTAKLVELLEGEGFEVTATKSLGLDSEWQIGNSDPSVWAQLAREINSDAADCILLACSGIRTLPIIDSLEMELGKPVVSAPAATMWHALRTIGVKDRVSGFGKLFELH
jgi:maleate isomerase